MDQHPGDTFSARFLTFWGVLAAIAAVVVLLGLYRWIFLPSSSTVNDGGAGEARAATLAVIAGEQRAEYEKAAAAQPGTVRLPADAVLSYAVSVLKEQKAAPGAILTPEAAAREQEAKSKATHDPDVSAFEAQ